MNIAAALAATTTRPALSPEQRAQLINMVGGDLKNAADMLAYIAECVSAIDPNFVSSQDLAEAVRAPVADLKSRARALAEGSK
jgi:hypothetical protein